MWKKKISIKTYGLTKIKNPAYSRPRPAFIRILSHRKTADQRRFLHEPLDIGQEKKCIKNCRALLELNRTTKIKNFLAEWTKYKLTATIFGFIKKVRGVL